MIYDKDADLGKLEGKTVAILGYGSQGHAHALNLKDSGVDVVVGLREDSSSVEKAKRDGLRVTSIADAASEGDVVMVLLPDEKQAEVWESEISDVSPPHRTTCSPNRSVSVSSVKVVSSTPARVPPMASA